MLVELGLNRPQCKLDCLDDQPNKSEQHLKYSHAIYSCHPLTHVVGGKQQQLE